MAIRHEGVRNLTCSPPLILNISLNGLLLPVFHRGGLLCVGSTAFVEILLHLLSYDSDYKKHPIVSIPWLVYK